MNLSLILLSTGLTLISTEELSRTKGSFIQPYVVGGKSKVTPQGGLITQMMNTFVETDSLLTIWNRQRNLLSYIE